MSTFKFMPNQDLAIPRGSTILVTGVSGMIATHIADEALKAGFRVRGTVRSKGKGQQVASLLQSSNFEFVVVEDMAVDGAFDETMKGASAVIHCASILNFSGVVDNVIPPTVKGTLNVLNAALANPSVRVAVFTSTITAACGPQPGIKSHIGRDSWNETAIDLIRNTTPQKQIQMGFDWGYMVYVASKIEAERAAWDFVRQKTPPFVVNVVNPAMNWGNVMGPIGISGTHIPSILDGKIPAIPSMYMCDTIDDARIHLAAAIDSTVTNERIFVCDSPFNWRLVIEIIQKTLPDAHLPVPDPNEALDIRTVDNETGAYLLKKWWGQPGYKGLTQTVQETLQMCLENRHGEYKRRTHQDVEPQLTS